MSEVKKIIKKKRVVSGKSFRLLDFHIFDQQTKEHDSDESSTEKQSSKQIEPKHFVIQMIGINEKGESCCVYINDYQPFFYLRIGYDWVSDDACELLQYIRNKIGRYHSPGVVSIEIVDHYKLYGFSGGQKNKFVKITFKNTTTMNRVRGLWYTYLTAEERINSQDYRRLTPLIFKNNLNDFTFSNPGLAFWIILAGPMTVIPLFLYIKGVELSGLGPTGMIFYITPSLQFLLGYFHYNEPFSPEKWISFILIWIAVFIYLKDLYENN